MSINIKKKEIAVDFIYYLRVKPMYWLFFKYSIYCISVCPCSKAAFIEEKTHAVYVKKMLSVLQVEYLKKEIRSYSFLFQ